MKQGSNAYIEIRARIDISLVSEMIFSFFAGDSEDLIIQKRFPDDVTEVGGRYYLGFTQEDTAKLYKNSENGEVQMETQVNLANKSVIQQPVRGFKIRRTRAVETVPGNVPHYEIPDTAIDIVTGNVVLLRGRDGKDGTVNYATFELSTEDGCLHMYTTDDYTGPQFVISEDGDLEVVING